MPGHGHDPGHPAAGVALAWDDYLAGLVAEHGRRANGLAYGYHRLGDHELALAWARRAAAHAGDAGHVRLRAMALLMLVRIAGGTDEGRAAHARAGVIAASLDDHVLRRRCVAAARDLGARGDGAAADQAPA